MQQLIQLLPPRIWVREGDGQRRTAVRGRTESGCDEILGGLRNTAVTRLFIDPAIDDASGEVHGTILRLAPLT